VIAAVSRARASGLVKMRSGLGHPRVLTPARVGQRPIAVVRPTARIRVPRVGMAHHDETPAVYYRTVAPPISLPRRDLRPTLMAR